MQAQEGYSSVNRESIEARIDELNLRKKVTKQKIRDLEKQLERVEGRIEEMWNWHDIHRDTGEYGHHSLEGGVRVLKVPKFKAQEEMERALSGEPAAIDRADEKETIRAREARARLDGQQLIDNLDGNSPLDKREDANNWEADSES